MKSYIGSDVIPYLKKNTYWAADIGNQLGFFKMDNTFKYSKKEGGDIITTALWVHKDGSSELQYKFSVYGLVIVDNITKFTQITKERFDFINCYILKY